MQLGEWAEILNREPVLSCMRCTAVDDDENPVVLVADELICYQCLNEGGYFGEHT